MLLTFITSPFLSQCCWMLPPVSGVSPVTSPVSPSSEVFHRNVSGPIPGLEPGSPLSQTRIMIPLSVLPVAPSPRSAPVRGPTRAHVPVNEQGKELAAPDVPPARDTSQ